MTTKTISISVEAYEHLKAAILFEQDSFSKVICREICKSPRGTAGDLLKRVAKLPSNANLELLDEAQKHDVYRPL